MGNNYGLNQNYKWRNVKNKSTNPMKIVLKVLIVLFCLIGIYKTVIWAQYQYVKYKVENIELASQYDEDLGYHKEGEPIFMIDPSNTTTLFFLDDYRTQRPGELYKDWFKEIHNKHKVNIIVPVYALQSSNFQLRNEEWSYKKDIRTILQFYDGYTSMLPKNHKIITVSQSSGAVANIAIGAKGKREVNSMILLSPLNSSMEYRGESVVNKLISKYDKWLRYGVLFTKSQDINNDKYNLVNSEASIDIIEKYESNLENNLNQNYELKEVAKWMEETLALEVKNKNIKVIWGDKDIFSSNKGFNKLADALNIEGNSVKTLELEGSGHMLMIDKHQEEVRKIILDEIMDN